MKCPACYGTKLPLFMIRADDAEFVRCERCGLIICKNPKLIKYEKSYFNKETAEKIGYQEYSKDPLFELYWQIALVKLLGGREGLNVLDIGCATGRFLELATDEGLNADGLDISKYSVNICLEKGLSAYEADINKLDRLPNHYDFICAWDVIEHLEKIPDFFEKINEALRKTSIFIFSTPNATNKASDWEGFNNSFEHFIYFTEQALKIILGRVGNLHIGTFHIEHANLDSLFGIVTKEPDAVKKNQKIIDALKKQKFVGNKKEDFLLASIYANFNLKNPVRAYLRKYRPKNSLISLSTSLKYSDIDKFERNAINQSHHWLHNSYGWQYLLYAKNLKLELLSSKIKSLEEENSKLRYDLEFIYNSRSWRYTQFIRKFKKLYLFGKQNICRFYRIFIAVYFKYKIGESRYISTNHDFVIIKKETNKWQIDDFERVGYDWHIRVKRKKDNKIFLLDAPFFYILQLFNSKEILQELFITYGTRKEEVRRVQKVIKQMNLC